MARKPSFDFDIIIVGGGMVGASLAVALTAPDTQGKELKIALIDTVPFPESFPKKSAEIELSPSFDGRSTALSYGSRNLLEKMGLWSDLAELTSAIESIRVSSAGQPGSVTLEAPKLQVPALGYVVENRDLGQSLIRRLHEQGLVSLLGNTRVTRVRHKDQGMILSLESNGEPSEYSTSLVVLADGGRSPLAHQLGLEVQTTPYQQSAVIANVAFDRDHDNRAHERFTPDGPLALLPLNTLDGESRMALVWTHKAKEAEGLLELSDAEFMSRLQQQFGFRSGRVVRVGERVCYPLSLTRSLEQIRSGLVMLGNAAHTLHPIAGQGFNLALRGVSALADYLLLAGQNNESIGDLSLLERYLLSRRRDQQLTINISDGLVKLFGSRIGLLRVGLGTGLLAMDQCSLAKELFALRSMGMDEPLSLSEHIEAALR